MALLGLFKFLVLIFDELFEWHEVFTFLRSAAHMARLPKFFVAILQHADRCSFLLN